MPSASHMTRVLLGLIAIALLGTLAVSLEGCTVAGLLMGMSTDNDASKGGPGKLLQVKPGQWVSLECYDHTVRQGRFIALERDSGAADSAAATLVQNQSVRIKGERGDERIAVSSISIVRTVTSRGTIAGLLIGATIDVLIIRSAKHQAENTACSGTWPSFGSTSMSVPDSLDAVPPELAAEIEHQRVTATP